MHEDARVQGLGSPKKRLFIPYLAAGIAYANCVWFKNLWTCKLLTGLGYTERLHRIANNELAIRITLKATQKAQYPLVRENAL